MNPTEIAEANRLLRDRSPLEIIRWAIDRAGGRAIVSTNYRPYEAVVLHLVTQVLPDIPVLWVDHGYNRPATYRHAEALRAKLGLNLKPYLPLLTPAHRDAIFGPIPTTEDEAGLKRFSAQWKGRRVELTLTEFWIVHSLARHPGHVKNREQLMREANLVVDDDTVTSHMKRIRRKFQAIAPAFDEIETVYGMGYRWKG